MNIIEDVNNPKNIDIQILKEIFTKPHKSIYSINEELSNKSSEKKWNANYATVKRHSDSLIANGLIYVEKGTRKNGIPGSLLQASCECGPPQVSASSQTMSHPAVPAGPP